MSPKVLTVCVLLAASAACSEERPASPTARAIERSELATAVRAALPEGGYRVSLASLPRSAADGTVTGPGAAVVQTVVVRAGSGDCDPGALVPLARQVSQLSDSHGCGAAVCVRLFCLGEQKMQMFLGMDPTRTPLWADGALAPLPLLEGSEEPVN